MRTQKKMEGKIRKKTRIEVDTTEYRKL